MKNREGALYDVMKIMNTFNKFLEKDTNHISPCSTDPYVFRGGDAKELGELLEATATALKKKMNNIPFVPYDQKLLEKSVETEFKKRFDHSIESLYFTANAMKESGEEEPEDYHWLIIADLIDIIDVLLKKIASNSNL